MKTDIDFISGFNKFIRQSRAAAAPRRAPGAGWSWATCSCKNRVHKGPHMGIDGCGVLLGWLMIAEKVGRANFAPIR